MPRTQIEPQFPTERLSILDSDGKLDTKLEPKLSPDDLKRLYRAMVLGRRLDERMLKLQRQGRIGNRKAAVLPLPVMAQARMSRPSRAGGMASSWIGVGRVKPSSLSPRQRWG